MNESDVWLDCRMTEVKDLKMVNKTVKWNICYKKENMIKPRTLNKNKLP